MFEFVRAVLQISAKQAIVNDDWPEAARYLAALMRFTRHVWDEYREPYMWRAFWMFDASMADLASVLLEHADSLCDAVPQAPRVSHESVVADQLNAAP